MIEPVTIVTTVLTVSKVVSQLAITLYSFVQSAREVDKSLGSLLAQVEGLKTAVTTIKRSLENPSLRTSKAVNTDEDTVELWSSTEAALVECKETCEELDQLLRNMQGKGKRGPIRLAIRQVKMDWESGKIGSLRRDIKSHSRTIQLALAMINLYAYLVLLRSAYVSLGM